MKRVTITTAKPYDVVIGSGVLDRVGELLLDIFPLCKVYIVTDSTVNGLYANRVAASLENAGYSATKVAFPSGEHSKNLTTYANVLESMARDGITRSDVILALGGGVVGDISGFAAATYMRGIQYVQVPTTLLAAIDSSIGGKTGVDLQAGKNLVGAMWQPSLVVTDPDTFGTLPEHKLKDGMAEAVKSAIISDSGLITYIAHRDYEYVIERCVSIKKSLVEADERDSGVRNLLNFGHTLGHGIEKLSSYSISHGQAVAKGMVGEARAAYKLGLCKNDLSEEIARILETFDLDGVIPFDAENMYQQALMDKKIMNGAISVIVPNVIGRCTLHKLDLKDLRAYVDAALDA